jgi:hypothetical protein
MAVNYSNYPAYRAAVEKVRKLQNRLNLGTTGLADAMDRVAAQKGEDSPEYIKIKAEFDKVQAELETATASAKAMRQQIDEEEASKETKKNAASKAKSDNATIKQLEYERDSLKRQNKLEEANAKQAEIDAIQTPKAKDGKEPVAEEGGFYDDYAFGDGKVTRGGLPGVFVDKIKGDTTQPEFYTDFDKARLEFLKGYSAPGKLKELQNQLINSNYIKQSEIAAGTWYEGLDEMLIARSVKLVSDLKYGGGQFITAEDFLKTKKESSGTSKVYRNLSTRGDARQQIDDYLTDLTGSGASDEEYEEYYKLLNAEEKRQTMTSSGGTTVGDVMTDAERFVIAAKVARKRLKNTDVDALLSSKKGSQVSMDISALQELAADYGIDMTPAEALKQVTLGIGQKNYLEKQQERLKLIAKKMHPGLADHIDAGGTVLDIANTYARAKFNKLGVVVKSPTKDKDVMDAVASGKSISQFDKEMQGKPEWRFTDEAREVTSSFLDTIGKMWGRG